MASVTLHRLIVAVIVCALGSTQYLTAQSGLTMAEMREKLGKYFAEELLADLEKPMPKGATYRIWGWDVGDFTGDGYNDVALSVYTTGTRKKECTVHMFADVEGFLVDVAMFTVPFVDLPLEVGVVIKDTTCFIARKKRSDDWSMKGYRFVAGSVVLVDEFNSNKVNGYPHEDYRNYLSLDTREQFTNTKDKVLFQSDYLTIPCYERGRQLFAGTNAEVRVGSVRQVLNGSYWWKGADDASFAARLVYDDNNLYVRVNVTDSTVVTGWCDTCPADRVELWFELNELAKGTYSRAIQKVGKRGIELRNEVDSGIYALAVKIGDFEEVPPTVKVKTTDDLDQAQNAALERVRVVTVQKSDGYVVKLKIPWELLGFAQAPVDDDSLTEYGCTIVLYDVDNEFRPEETTTIASSPLSSLDPSTYGAISMVPAGKWYGETRNIFAEGVMATLRELGF
ncbi:MAG: hypothetical protein J5I53_09295 [Bradyrhizobiaceae bacterium]|nr:hypothetical protein [Bradyrhizobiaceae bacterium]